MVWEYVLAGLAGALITFAWQRWRLARSQQAPVGREELESVLEEFVTGAEALLEELEERRVAMETLLGEADQRLASLGSAPAGAAALPAPPAVAVPSEDVVRAAAALVAAAQSRAASPILPVSPVSPAAVGPPAKMTSGKPSGKPSGSRKNAEEVTAMSRHQEVFNLDQRGLDAAEIARITGRTTGEVQLILGLQRSLH
ncbi:MAG: hypothetical protein ACYC5Y_15640 [Symbiobacteriia bacterium]